MKKIIFTMVLSLIGVTVIAQTKETPQCLKYITQAPDGSVAMTIYDDSREDNMKLESANDFYRYEILEPSISEAIYTSRNSGKTCTIDKTKITAGTYNLRLYTSNFVITSKIIIAATKKMYSSLQTDKDIIASRE